MERRGVLIILLLVLAVFALAKTDFSGKLQGYAIAEGDVVISDAVMDKVQNQGQVRVMINLKAREHKGKTIASEQTKSEISEILGKEINEFDDKISAVVSADELEALKKSGEVKSIELVKTRSISLQDSVPLVNADDVWSIETNGVNLTGEGQTVCIIDTGVNYNHVDLGGCFGEGCKVVGGWDFCADDANCTTEDADPMDNHGHGTHVAGIVAANGLIKGIAPGANIAMVKASNASGTFWDDDLEKAIQWCIDNASELNISVISMSLGGGLYSDYCNDDPLNDSINAAVDAGLSVIIATGNDGSTSQIAAPSCMETVIPAGASDKSDNLYVYGNRNNLVKLVAPGENINSTYRIGNTYVTASGTSMSTPHIAGAFAIIKQYADLNSLNLSSIDIEDLLYDTGKKISDFGEDYSRIDIKSALLSLDSEAPSVTLESPENYVVDENQNQTFKCKASDLQLSELKLQVWDSENNLVNETGFNVTSNTFEGEQAYELSNGKYYWNCYASDSKGNSAYADENNTLRVGNISMTLSSPANNTYTNVEENEFICNVQNSLNLSEIKLELWNSTDLIYEETKNISGTNNESSFLYNLSEEGSYEWNCLAVDEEANEITSDYNAVLVYDSSAPVISLISPENDYTADEDTEINVEYSVLDNNEVASCDLVLDGNTEETDSDVELNTTESISISLSEGNYNWKIVCSDLAGNSNTSEERNVVVEAVQQEEEGNQDDSESDDSSDSGSESGASQGLPSGANYFYIMEDQLGEEVKRTMKNGDVMLFNISNKEYSVRAQEYSEEEATILISYGEDFQKLNLPNTEKEKVNLDNDTTYDLEVSYEYVNTMAQVGIKKIDEEIPTREIVSNKTDTPDSSGLTGQAVKGKLDMSKETKIAIGIILLVGVLGVVGFYLYRNNDKLLGATFKKKYDEIIHSRK